METYTASGFLAFAQHAAGMMESPMFFILAIRGRLAERDESDESGDRAQASRPVGGGHTYSTGAVDTPDSTDSTDSIFYRLPGNGRTRRR